jgi:hypothetical protein
MNKQSKENLISADRAELKPFQGESNGGGVLWAIYVFRGDRLAVIHGGDGFVMFYPSPGAAERAIKRLNSALPFTVAAK